MNKKKLEIAINDACNLQCKMCSQAVPLIKNKKTTTLEEIKTISKYMKSNEFEILFISGGEPTIHPEFRSICKQLPNLFKCNRYELYTNGYKLGEYLDDIDIFDYVIITHYPGYNDYASKYSKISNVKFIEKELCDIMGKPNIRIRNPYEKCILKQVKKITQGRIANCCAAFSVCIYNNLDYNKYSVPINSEWRENLEKIEKTMDNLCWRCWSNCKDEFDFNGGLKLVK